MLAGVQMDIMGLLALPMLEVMAGQVTLTMEEEGWVVAKTPPYCITVAGCIVFPYCAGNATPAGHPP